MLDRRLQINVIRADPRRHSQLQLGRLRDPLGGQIRRPKRLRDHDLRIAQLALEHRLSPVLVRRDYEVVTTLLEEPPQPKLTRHAPNSSPGVKSIASGVGVVWPSW